MSYVCVCVCVCFNDFKDSYEVMMMAVMDDDGK